MFDKLNEQQIEAVKHIDGPCLVIAGAGSGKTKVLTTRIANLLEQGISDKNILAITFTNKAAKEMRERLNGLVFNNHVFVGTFHSFGLKIIRENVDNLGMNKNFTILDSEDVLSLIKKIMKEKGIDTKELSPYYVRSRISFIKNEDLSDAEIEKYLNSPLEKIIIEIYYEYVKLLKKNNSVDFDDFVLSVLKKQYLENKKPNEIVYSNSDVTIPVSSLKENVYKFEKIPEKIKSFIQTAKTIQSAMRDYEHFDDKKLKERLNYYAGQAIGNNETVFDRIVEFDAADISGENRDLLIKFLKVFDDFKDREKTIYEVLDIIEEEDLRPKAPAGGEDIDETERQKAIEALKRQQKMAFELDSLKSEFDNAMNTLYANNLSSTAAICSKYRPSNLDYTVTENAEFIINQTKSLDKSDKNMVKSKIKNFDTYNYYKNNDYKNPVFADALKYAENDDGKTDIDKAGRYLANSEIVMNAPQSLEYLKNKDFLENVINRSPDKNAAVKYLCKYDEYNEMSTKEKSHLLSFVDKFNLKDSIDKFILKNIIENDYINTDTVSLSGTNDSDRVEATISANAKQQIIHKYMYPRCLEFFTGFEEALKQFATDRGTSGIKKTGTKNKALDYKLELKLMGHDDRLFSVENNYYFDIFSDKGLH